MNITAKNHFNLKEISKNIIYDLDYGTIKSGTDTNRVINIEGANHLSCKSSCGCTDPIVQINTDGTFDLTISYRNNKMGKINQWVKETVELAGSKEQQTIVFNLKGTIV